MTRSSSPSYILPWKLEDPGESSFSLQKFQTKTFWFNTVRLASRETLTKAGFRERRSRSRNQKRRTLLKSVLIQLKTPCVMYDQVKTGSWESEAEAEELRLLYSSASASTSFSTLGSFSWNIQPYACQANCWMKTLGLDKTSETI